MDGEDCCERFSQEGEILGARPYKLPSSSLAAESYKSRPTPSAPRAPVHRGILVHLRCFKIFVSQFIRQTKLLVRLILCGPTDVGLVISCVRENVVGLPVFLDQGHFARRKCLEFLLLRGSAGDDYFEARGDQKVLFVLRLRASAAHCQCEKRKGADKTESGELGVSWYFHSCRLVGDMIG